MRFASLVFLAAIVFARSASADSVTELQFLLNSVTIQSKNSTTGANIPFSGANFTGELSFGTNPALSTEQVLVDGTTVVDMNSLASMGLSGSLNFSSGQVQSGSLQITGTLAGHPADSYQCDLVIDTGSIFLSGLRSSPRYVMSASTASGILSGKTFGGADVSTWYDRQPLAGSFFQINYKPDANGFDDFADIRVAALATVPLPKSAWMGIALFGFLGVGVVFSRLNSDRRSLIS